MPSPPNAAQLVAQFGARLFGPEWGADLARLTGVNVRTIQRIKTAAAAGRDYPAAGGILEALDAQLAAVRADLKPYVR